MVASTRGSFKGWMFGTASEDKDYRQCNNLTVAYRIFTGAISWMMFYSLAEELTLKAYRNQ